MSIEQQLKEYQELVRIRKCLKHIIDSIDDDCSMDYVKVKLKKYDELHYDESPER